MKANKGKYILVVEGAIPTKDNGIYCKVGGQTAIEMLKECAADAAAVIAIGSCASWGGMPSTPPNPTGATSAGEVLGKVIPNIPGCPPNPYNFLSTVVHFLTFGKLPDVDEIGRPKFAYSRLIHENCERRAHFDAGRFAMEFGDEGHKQRLLPVQAGLQGSGDLRQLPGDPVRRRRQCELAGRHAVTRASAAPRRASVSPSRSMHWPNLKSVRPPAGFPAHHRRSGQGRQHRRDASWRQQLPERQPAPAR